MLALWRRLFPRASNVITLADLERAGACYGYLVRFRRLFGRRVVVTEELAVRYALDFPLGWAATRFLTEEGFRQFCAIKRVSESCDQFTENRARVFARLLLTHRQNQ